MLYLNPSRFAARCVKSSDTQFVNYVGACCRNPLLTDPQKRQWLSTALEAEAQRNEPRQYRIKKMNQKRASLKSEQSE